MCNPEKKKVPTQGIVSSTKKVNLLARETGRRNKDVD